MRAFPYIVHTSIIQDKLYGFISDIIWIDGAPQVGAIQESALNWIAYAGALASAIAAGFLFWSGFSEISDLGLTAQSAIFLTVGGMLAIVSIGLAVYARPRKNRTGAEIGAPRDDDERTRR
jgi:hypothetical protein